MSRQAHGLTPHAAKTGKRLHPMTRSIIQAGLAGPSDVSRVVME